MSTNLKIIHNKDQDNNNIVNLKEDISNIYETSSQAIYRISPIIIKEDNNICFPIISADDTNSHNIKSIIKDNFIEKFNLSDDQRFDNDYKLIKIATNLNKDDDYIQLREPEDEDEPRKYYDKFNLFQSFYFSSDPLGNKSEFVDEEETCEIKFETMEDKFSRIFNITV
jgi:hypothetical protein